MFWKEELGGRLVGNAPFPLEWRAPTARYDILKIRMWRCTVILSANTELYVRDKRASRLLYEAKLWAIYEPVMPPSPRAKLRYIGLSFHSPPPSPQQSSRGSRRSTRSIYRSAEHTPFSLFAPLLHPFFPQSPDPRTLSNAFRKHRWRIVLSRKRVFI